MHVFDLAMWLFFCYSFLGWLAETALAAVRTRKYVDRSLLFGPVCVVYGAAGLLISASLGELSGSWFFLFLGSAIYATVVEWLAGHMLEKLTHTRWWDYSGHRWNLDGYISLRSSALWGLLGLALVRWGNPLLAGLYELLPPLAGRILLWVLLAVLALDILATGLTLGGVSGKLPRVEAAGNRLAALTVRMGTWVLGKTEGRIRKAHPEATFRAGPRERSAVFAQGCGFYKLFWLFLIGAFLGDVTETIFCRVTVGVWMSPEQCGVGALLHRLGPRHGAGHPAALSVQGQARQLPLCGRDPAGRRLRISVQRLYGSGVRHGVLGLQPHPLQPGRTGEPALLLFLGVCRGGLVPHFLP